MVFGFEFFGHGSRPFLNRSHDTLSINFDFSFYKGGPKFKIKKNDGGRWPPRKLKFCENTMYSKTTSQHIKSWERGGILANLEILIPLIISLV